MSGSPPFFVIGSARSGTTMLRLILNSHPLLAVPPESRFIIELLPPGEDVEVGSFLRRLAAHRHFQSWGIGIDAVARELQGQARLPFSQAISATFEVFARAHGKARWGDKTPRYIEHIPTLDHLFNGSRFIHLVRDGRDVALSYARTDFGPGTVARAARIWSRRVGLGLRHGRPLGPQRYLELRYERFIGDMEVVVREVCSFIGVDFDPQMLDEEERARGINKSRSGRYNLNVAKKPTKRARSWEQEMSPAQVEVFEAIAGPLLSELGYPRRYPRPRPTAHLRAKAGLIGIPLDRLRSEVPITPAAGPPPSGPPT